jgi:acetyltransferase-like isoleucine patch superfamily enzyme
MARKVLAVEVTSELLELLRARRVYHRPHKGDRWKVGDRLRFPSDLKLEPFSHIHSGGNLPARLGAFSYVRSGLGPNIQIGRYCSIGADIRWLSDDHPFDWATSSPVFYDPQPLQGVRSYLVEERHVTSFPLKTYDSRPGDVIIGNDVWIGDGVAIAGGVRIGDGAVVAAGTIVTRDVEPYSVMAGVPAKPVRLRFSQELTARLLASRWWRYGPEVLQPLTIQDPESFLDQLAVLPVEALVEFAPETTLTSDEIVKAAGGVLSL